MENDKNTSLENTNNVNVLIPFFNENGSFAFVYKKTEKLVTAIYMVTNLFSDNEPIKWDLRKKSTNLLSFITSYKDLVYSQRTFFLDNVKIIVMEIISLLEVSSRSGMISFMNFSVLKQEFLNLTKSIEESNNSLEKNSGLNLSKSFFSVPKPDNFSETNTSAKSENFQFNTNNVVENNIKDIGFIKDKIELKKTNRQDMIINLLKKKSDLSIKEVSQVVKGCSEKTIQRELISLISAGIIKKTGERRWSRYSVING